MPSALKARRRSGVDPEPQGEIRVDDPLKTQSPRRQMAPVLADPTPLHAPILLAKGSSDAQLGFDGVAETIQRAAVVMTLPSVQWHAADGAAPSVGRGPGTSEPRRERRNPLELEADKRDRCRGIPISSSDCHRRSGGEAREQSAHFPCAREGREGSVPSLALVPSLCAKSPRRRGTMVDLARARGRRSASSPIEVHTHLRGPAVCWTETGKVLETPCAVVGRQQVVNGPKHSA